MLQYFYTKAFKKLLSSYLEIVKHQTSLSTRESLAYVLYILCIDWNFQFEISERYESYRYDGGRFV